MVRMNHRSRFLLVIVAALALIVVDRVRRGQGFGESDEGISGQTSSRSVKTRSELAPVPSPDPAGILVNADGGEFRWRFRFAGRDGELGTDDDIVADDELHLPAEAMVHLTVTSRDNVYVFSVPSLQLRRVAVPELIYRVDFRSGTPQSHDAVMDAMCGAPPWYGPTMGRIRVESQDAFDQWFQALQKGRAE